MLDEQPQRLRGLGQIPSARARRVPTGSVSPRAARISAILFTGQEPDGIAGCRLGHDRLQAVLGVETENVLRGTGPLGTLRGQRRVGPSTAADKILANRGHGIIPTKSLRA